MKLKNFWTTLFVLTHFFVINKLHSVNFFKTDEVSVFGGISYSNKKISNPLSIFGSLKATESEFDKLTVNGLTTLKNVIVNGELIVNGITNAIKSKFNSSIEIQGELNSEDSVFHDSVKVFGLLTGRKSKFNNLITIDSKLILDQSETKDIVVELKGNKKQRKEEVILKRGTIVNGNLKFISGKGIIKKSDDSVIKGEIIGGVVNKY